MKTFYTLLVISVCLINPLFSQIYVATDGNDSNNGTLEQPYKTIPKAISMAQAGDKIYLRGGTYALSTTITISSSKSGTENSRYYLWAYPGERPLLDFSTTQFGDRGIQLEASYWYFQGFDVKGAGDNGLYISGGSNNIIEFCTFYENRDTGLQLASGAADNQIINCDSYYNADPPDYGDADGFAPKLTVGSGNYFYGCRAWGNCDDGWDGYMRGATDVTTTLDHCWTWGNGYLKDGTDPGSQANGNGFKMGGGDNSNSAKLMHHHVLKNCMAFSNKAKGFDQNNNVGSMTLLNCTGYANGSANYRIQKSLNSGQTLTVTNSVSYNGSVELGSFAVQQTNSWMTPFNVSAADFVSLDPETALAPRQEDGSLPEIELLHLAQGSDLIDGGTDIGLPFQGAAPDLGAFETGIIASIPSIEITQPDFTLFQNFPNPFNPATTIKYRLHKPAAVMLKIYNIAGQEVATLADASQNPGEYAVKWQPSGLSNGIYFYQLRAGNFCKTMKLILQK